MQIRIRATGAVMYEGEFRTYQKSIGGPSWEQTTPEVLEALDADPVFEGPQASGGDQYQYSMRSGVEQGTDGKWYTKYILGPVFVDAEEQTAQEQETAYKALKDEQQAVAIRNDRNQRLKDCDWTQGKDIPNTISTPWATYRQSLRDVPLQLGFPWNVEWPVEP